MKFKVVAGKRGKFVLRWNSGSGWQERTTDLPVNESNRAKAYRLLSTLESELRGEIPPALTLPTRVIRTIRANDDPVDLQLGEWSQFREHFQQNHLNQLSSGYRTVMMAIIGKFESFANPVYVAECKSPIVRRWLAHEQKSVEDTTVHTYWRHLSAFLRVAVEDGVLSEMPKIRLPKIDRRSMAKGRAISLEEFERMHSKAKELRPRDGWGFVLDGMWYGGLRVGEMHILTWEESDFWVDIERQYPCFQIKRTGQKNRTSETLPITPDFAEILKFVPKSQRYGFVYDFPSARGNGKRLSLRQVKKVIAEIGEKSNVKVGANKTATAHDLRRSFGSRWAMKVTPQVLQRLMRHADIQTTMRYYVDLDSDNLAKMLYDAQGGHEGGQGTKKSKKPTQKRKPKTS